MSASADELALEPGADLAAGHPARDLQPRRHDVPDAGVARGLLDEDEAEPAAQPAAETRADAAVVGRELAEVAVRRRERQPLVARDLGREPLLAPLDIAAHALPPLGDRLAAFDAVRVVRPRGAAGVVDDVVMAVAGMQLQLPAARPRRRAQLLPARVAATTFLDGAGVDE